MSDELASPWARAGFSAAAGLIRRAACRAPRHLAERLEEEWLADLSAQPSIFTGLSFALGCCWATCVIAREHRAASAALSASGRTSVTLGEIRSRSMSRLKWLWVVAAAVAVTAAGMYTVFLLAGHVLPLLVRYRAYVGSFWIWGPVALGGGSMLQMIVRTPRIQLAGPRHQRLGRWTGRLVRRGGRPWFAAQALVLAAASGLLFAGSARLFTMSAAAAQPNGVAAAGMVHAAALFFAAIGAGLLVVLACAYCSHRRHLDGEPAGPTSASGSGWH